ncbi:MAG: (d)CMP kinase [Synergistaceae bacterium]|nr:(d)CMP kinase [Synergistaceae bacterium]
MIIAIDGPAGAGKSSISKKVASKLGLNYLDTGALYRALAYALDVNGTPPAQGDRLNEELKKLDVQLVDGMVIVNGTDVSKEIRTPHVDKIVSPYSALSQLRERLLDLQRRQAFLGKGIVAEGRDIGSVVFPEADIKIFLTASPEERAMRRYKERLARGESAIYEEVLQIVKERDRIDSTREAAPLVKPEGAYLIDSSFMSEQQVVDEIIGIAAKNSVL